MSAAIPPVITVVNEDSECQECGGLGWYSVDRARGHEHYTEEFPCPDCRDSQPNEFEREEETMSPTARSVFR